MQQIGKFLGATSAAALAVVALSGAARADDAPKLGYSLTLSATSDYIFRGISYTNEKPAFQPYLEFTYGIGYLGFWGSNIGEKDFSNYGPWELDVYLGIRPTTGPINWDIGVLYYSYGQRILAGAFDDKRPSRSDLDYFEFQVAATTSPVQNLTLGLKGYTTPDQDTSVSQTWTVEGSANYTLPSFKVSGADWTPTVGGSVGYTNADPTADYPIAFVNSNEMTYWNVGMKIVVDKWFMDFRYWDTDISDKIIDGELTTNDMADGRFLFTAGVTLP